MKLTGVSAERYNLYTPESTPPLCSPTGWCTVDVNKLFQDFFPVLQNGNYVNYTVCIIHTNQVCADLYKYNTSENNLYNSLKHVRWMFLHVYWHTLSIPKSRAQKVGKKWTYMYKVSEQSASFYVPVVGECISKALKGPHYFRTTTKVNSWPKTSSSTVNPGWQVLTDTPKKTKAFKYNVLRFVSHSVNLMGKLCC